MLSWAMILIFLVLSVILGRRNALYYLIFPFALIQGPGAFIDPDILLFGGFAFGRDIIIFSYMALAIKAGRPNAYYVQQNKLLKLYTLFLVVLLLLSFAKLSFSWRILSIFRIFLYIPLYYYFFSRVLGSVTKQQFIDAVNAFFVINVISAVMYIVNSANILHIFPYDPWIVIEDGSRTFYRDLLTIPIFYSAMFLLSLTMLFNKEYLGIQKLLIFLNIFLSVVVLLFTFTRGDVFNFLFILILLTLVHIIYAKTPVFKKITAVSLAMLIIASSLIAITKAFPGQVDYFASRYASLESGILQDDSFFYRIGLLEKAWSAIRSGTSETFLFGMGFSQDEMLSMAAISGSWMGDIMWPFFILYTGIIGTLLFLFIILSGIASSFRHYIKTRNLWFEFIFVSLIFHLLRSINGPGFNDATGLAMLPFALLTVEINGLWRYDEQAFYWEYEDDLPASK